MAAAVAAGDWTAFLRDVEPMLQAIVERNARPLPPGQDMADARQCARLAALEAARAWRPGLGSTLRSWLWGCVTRRVLGWRGRGWMRTDARPFVRAYSLDEAVGESGEWTIQDVVPDPAADPSLWRERLDAEAALEALRGRWRAILRLLTPRQRRRAQAWLEVDGSLVEAARKAGATRKAIDNAALAVRRVVAGGSRHNSGPQRQTRKALRARWGRIMRHGRGRNRTNLPSAPENKTAKKSGRQAGERDAVSE